MKKITLLISAMAFVIGGFAQNRVAQPIQSTTVPTEVLTQRTCAAMDNFSQQDMQNLEEFMAPRVAAYLAAQANGGNPEVIYNIPVIVHVIHNSNESVGSGRNIANLKVQEQMDVLNKDFRRTNTDANNVWSQAADCEINFCLVTKYPSGHPQAGQTLPEVGVDRVDAAAAGFGNTTSGYSTTNIDGTIKPATSWNPNEVMNVWVCQLQSGLLGYAQFPNSGAANTDGVVISYSYFGLNGTVFGKGRTTTHEVGHYLGCYHIWGDDNGACSGSDQVSDTPNQANSTNSCPTGVQTDACAASAPGYMYPNYMDYTYDNCMNMFSAGQKARIQSAMASAPRRSTLNAASTTLCAAPGLTAAFTESATTINAGQTITFTDASTGPNTITSWNWNFDVTSNGGVTPPTANTQGTHAVTYNTAGTYTVSLTVGDGSTTDIRTKTQYITVQSAGSALCDSTYANWDWKTENYGDANWAADAQACSGNTAGAILGNNCYDDNGWAAKVSYSGTGKELTDVLYVFTRSQGSGAATLTVWNANGNGKDVNDASITTAPGTIMKSVTTTTGAYSASLNQFIQMPISPAIALTGDFYIGYDHPSAPANGDTLVMGVATGTHNVWANESGIGWRNVDYWGAGSGGNGTSMAYKGTVVAVICDIATGEKEILGQLNNVLVYPNPSIGTLNVALTEKANSTVTVLNMLGEVVASQTKNSQLFTFDINNQPNGVYFIRITTGDKVTTKKVLLTK